MEEGEGRVIWEKSWESVEKSGKRERLGKGEGRVGDRTGIAGKLAVGKDWEKEKGEEMEGIWGEGKIVRGRGRNVMRKVLEGKG